MYKIYKYILKKGNVSPAKWRHRHGEKTYGHRAGGEEGEGGMYGEKHEAYTLSYIK